MHKINRFVSKRIMGKNLPPDQSATIELISRRLKIVIDDFMSDRTTAPVEIIDALTAAIISLAGRNPHTETLHLDTAAADLTAASKTIKERTIQKQLH